VLDRFRAWLLGYPFARRVILTTKKGESFRGILWGRSGDFYILKQAEQLRERANPLSIDGEFVTERWNVDYMQVLTTVDG
jgi:hypothetical protein